MSHVTDNKIPQGVCWDFRGTICKFWTPFHKFGTGTPKNFKFGTQIDLGMSHLMAFFGVHEMGHAEIYLCTRFEVFSFTHFKIREGSQDLEIRPMDPHHAPSGDF